MKLQQIDVGATIREANDLLENETDIPPAFRSVFKLLILLVKILADSKPPSSDPNREKKKKANGSFRKPNGYPVKRWIDLQFQQISIREIGRIRGVAH